MHPFDLPELLSDKSVSILLDLAVHISHLVNSPGPNHELVIRPSHPRFLLFRTFFHFSVSSAFIVFCWLTAPETCPLLLAPVSPPSSAKSSRPRRCTSTHSSCRLPRSAAENFATLLLSRLRAPVDFTCALTLFGGRLPLVVSF